MLRFIRRVPNESQPLGDFPQWFSHILYSRGIDRMDKAEKYLHGTLNDLHDPMLMQDMDLCITLIREAIARHERIVIYGDYDCDGVCASSILLETLREEGADVSIRIPSRHTEGYGLNCDAIEEIARQYQLLITVDCGITNLEEVRLARHLGLKVIVTDHHQLAEKLPNANAVLNPLLGDYPFRRLCGAGVALKICQALQGINGVQKRIDLAALATVADIVMLQDENRIIVREGLKKMADRTRPGLAALEKIANLPEALNAGHIGFQLAPRINAGGRLEDAAQCVRLLTTQDADEAAILADHLNRLNQERQAMTDEIIRGCMERMNTQVDFYRDQIIIISGQNWDPGVIGLAAGKLCEKYHFPTIVLTIRDGMATGSCRSIPGINIFQMLNTCKDLFTRFGGHEQAAGLAMDAALISEMRARLNRAISTNCDPTCYIPTAEYDVVWPLREVTVDNIRQLSLLEPTGYGNPAPVFLSRNASIQDMRAIGKTGNHLQVVLQDGGLVRRGIFFGHGNLSEKPLTNVDAMYVPSLNEFRGQKNAQLNLKAIEPAEGYAAVGRKEAFFRPVLQEMRLLASNNNKICQVLQPLRDSQVSNLLKSGRGTLLIAHEFSRAMQFAASQVLDIEHTVVTCSQAYNTLLLHADLSRLTDIWHNIILLDGDLLPGEADAIHKQCPRATLHALSPNPFLREMLRSIHVTRDNAIPIFRRMTGGFVRSLSDLTQDTAFSPELTEVILTVLSDLGVINYLPEPFRVSLVPKAQKADFSSHPLVQYLEQIYNTCN